MCLFLYLPLLFVLFTLGMNKVLLNWIEHGNIFTQKQTWGHSSLYLTNS